MKKRLLLLLLALPMAFQGYAQTNETDGTNIDFEEDTTHVTSLKDIVAMQELVFDKSYRSNVISGVWKRKKAFSVSYVNTTLTGKNLMIYNPETKDMKEQSPEYKSDWAVSIKRSRTIPFHKRAIADMVSLGLEFSALDLSANHFKKAEDFVFDSRMVFTEGEDEDNYYNSNERHYMPWGSDMYSFAYGMHIGPSITLAPFTKLNSPGLAHIRLQTYFTVGYRGSIMWLQGHDSCDQNFLDNKDDKRNWEDNEQEQFVKVSNSNKLSWAHGLVTTWGIRLNWKGLGFGYEIVKGDYDYKSFEKKVYGEGKFKFSESSQRITLSYIW